MKFRVQGEIDIPKEITELLTGMTYLGQNLPFQDIEMVLSQASLDRLSIILNLLYATQPMDDVRKHMEQILVAKQESIKPVVQNIQPQYIPYPVDQQQPISIPPAPYVMPQYQPVIAPKPPVELKTPALDVTTLGLNVAKTKPGAEQKSISSLSKTVRGRVG